MSIITRRTPPLFTNEESNRYEDHRDSSEKEQDIGVDLKAHDRFHEADRESYHAFPHGIATDFGESEAIVLKYLAFCISRKPHLKERKTWTFKSLSKIAEKFPYLRKSTLASIIKRMEGKKLIEIGNFNKWKHDRTQWYHVPQNYIEACENQKPITFNIHVASQFGLPAAVLYHNLTHWIREQCKDDELNLPVQLMSHEGLHEMLPYFSVKTIKRSLDKLTKGSVILKTSGTKPLYTLPMDHPIMAEYLERNLL